MSRIFRRSDRTTSDLGAVVRCALSIAAVCIVAAVVAFGAEIGLSRLAFGLLLLLLSTLV